MATSPNRIAGERTESVCGVISLISSSQALVGVQLILLCYVVLGAFPGQPLGSHALGGRGPLSAPVNAMSRCFPGHWQLRV